jgi:uncharacterized protein DUF6314
MTELRLFPARFEGRWHLHRDVFDILLELPGTFEGEALFEPVKDGLRYSEKGSLAFGGLTGLVTHRAYLWQFAADGLIDVYFEDGRLFHQFDPVRGRPRARHFCAPDDYQVVYDFRNWPQWRSEWRVEGPKKDYRMVSEYRPAT